MKVVQVLTYVSADGAYGGPVAVARNQCAHLAALGHEVHLVAGWDGAALLEIPGVHVHLHRVHKVPGLGFAGYLSPAVWKAVCKLGSTADAVHFHFARDLVQLPAALVSVLGRRPVVLQTHGMVRPDRRPVARVLDAVLVRPIYRRAQHHLLLTQQEIDDLPVVARSSRLRWHRIRNAVAVHRDRARWSSHAPTVLYVARLHARKRPVAFVEMAHHLVQEGFDGRFVMFGADEGEAAQVHEAISRLGLAGHVSYEGALGPDDVLSALTDAQVYVLPSVDEPFPMSLLEALAAGLPSVITDRTGLSGELATRGAASVTTGEPAAMAAAVQKLLTSSDVWQDAADRARQDAETNFSSPALAGELERIYQGAPT